jgi:hypothetical protein
VLKHGIALQLLEHSDAVRLGHDDVEQHHVAWLLAQDPECLLAACRRADTVALLLEAAGQEHPVERVVIDNEDAAGGYVNAHRLGLRAAPTPLRPAPAPRSESSREASVSPPRGVIGAIWRSDQHWEMHRLPSCFNLFLPSDEPAEGTPDA